MSVLWSLINKWREIWQYIDSIRKSPGYQYLSVPTVTRRYLENTANNRLWNAYSNFLNELDTYANTNWKYRDTPSLESAAKVYNEELNNWWKYTQWWPRWVRWEGIDPYDAYNVYYRWYDNNRWYDVRPVKEFVWYTYQPTMRETGEIEKGARLLKEINYLEDKYNQLKEAQKINWNEWYWYEANWKWNTKEAKLLLDSYYNYWDQLKDTAARLINAKNSYSNLVQYWLQ